MSDPHSPRPATQHELDVAADALHLARYGEQIQREYPTFLHGEGSDMQDNCYEEANAVRLALAAFPAAEPAASAHVHDGPWCKLCVEHGAVTALRLVKEATATRDAEAAIRSAGTPPASRTYEDEVWAWAHKSLDYWPGTWTADQLPGMAHALLTDLRANLIPATPPEPVGGREPVRESVVAAAVEWVEAHDALALGNPTGPPDSDLLERYSEACNDLLAVVSQNRVALQASPPTGVSDGVALDVERLRDAIYAVSVRHDWEHTTDREDRTEEIAAEYQRGREQADSEPQQPEPHGAAAG